MFEYFVVLGVERPAPEMMDLYVKTYFSLPLGEAIVYDQCVPSVGANVVSMIAVEGEPEVRSYALTAMFPVIAWSPFSASLTTTPARSAAKPSLTVTVQLSSPVVEFVSEPFFVIQVLEIEGVAVVEFGNPVVESKGFASHFTVFRSPSAVKLPVPL